MKQPDSLRLLAENLAMLGRTFLLVTNPTECKRPTVGGVFNIWSYSLCAESRAV
jgi:hypothetical protein